MWLWDVLSVQRRAYTFYTRYWFVAAYVFFTLAIDVIYLEPSAYVANDLLLS